MALLWQKTDKGTCYEVRTAGRTRRLYTDGVFHSQYSPAQAVTGGVWDCLMLPALFYPQGSIKRVLVLGVGGGAVIKLLQQFVKPQQIVGIELNSLHLSVARRFFDVKGKGVQLVQADAIKWMQGYQGPPFDMIIDDLFTEQASEPVRAVAANTRWFNTLSKHLSRNGLIVSNFISIQEFRENAWFSNKRLQQRFPCLFQFTTPLHENVVAGFLRQQVPVAQLRQTIKEIPQLETALKSKRLRYRLRQIR